jgi:hypothetical protein
MIQVEARIRRSFSADYILTYFKAKYNNEGSSGMRLLGGVTCD